MNVSSTKQRCGLMNNLQIVKIGCGQDSLFVAWKVRLNFHCYPNHHKSYKICIATQTIEVNIF